MPFITGCCRGLADRLSALRVESTLVHSIGLNRPSGSSALVWQYSAGMWLPAICSPEFPQTAKLLLHEVQLSLRKRSHLPLNAHEYHNTQTLTHGPTRWPMHVVVSQPLMYRGEGDSASGSDAPL